MKKIEISFLKLYREFEVPTNMLIFHATVLAAVQNGGILGGGI
jgi:hypothetical protein